MTLYRSSAAALSGVNRARWFSTIVPFSPYSSNFFWSLASILRSHLAFGCSGPFGIRTRAHVPPTKAQPLAPRAGIRYLDHEPFSFRGFEFDLGGFLQDCFDVIRAPMRFVHESHDVVSTHGAQRIPPPKFVL